MVRDKGGGWRCPRIWTGEKDGTFGESTKGVGGEGGVIVDGVIGDGGMSGVIAIIESDTIAAAAHGVTGDMGEVGEY